MITINADETIGDGVKRNLKENENFAYEKMYVRCKNYMGFYANTQGSNCKVFNVESIQTNLTPDRINIFKERLAEVADYLGKDIFQVTLTYSTNLPIMAKHFHLVGRADVPIGYGTGWQYHCTYATDKGYEKWKARFDANTVIAKPVEITQITAKTVEKVASYKYMGSLKKYLNKLINGETL